MYPFLLHIGLVYDIGVKIAIKKLYKSLYQPSYTLIMYFNYERPLIPLTRCMGAARDRGCFDAPPAPDLS